MKFKRFFSPSTSFVLGLGFILLLNYSCKHDSFPADQLPPLYYADVAPIFAVCTQCHSGGGGESRLDFSSYSSIMSTGGIVAGNSSKSEAYKAMISTFQIMPPNGALSTNERTKIRVWIDQGAKEKP